MGSHLRAEPFKPVPPVPSARGWSRASRSWCLHFRGTPGWVPPAEPGELLTSWGQGHLGEHHCASPLHQMESLPAPELTRRVVVCHGYATFSGRGGRLQPPGSYTSTFKCILTWSNNVTLVLFPLAHLFT